MQSNPTTQPDYWVQLLENNIYFNGRGELRVEFWRQNFVYFGSANIIHILGFGHLAIKFGNPGAALRDLGFMGQVIAALMERQRLDEFTAHQLVRDAKAQFHLTLEQLVRHSKEHTGSPIVQNRNLHIERILDRAGLYSLWDELLSNNEELQAYIAAMDTSGIDGGQMWDYISTSAVQLSAHTSNNESTVRTVGVPLCDICGSHKNKSRFALLPCCGSFNTIHKTCLRECASKKCDPAVRPGQVKCPFCRLIISLASVGCLNILDVSEQVESNGRGNTNNQQQNQASGNGNPSASCSYAFAPELAASELRTDEREYRIGEHDQQNAHSRGNNAPGENGYGSSQQAILEFASNDSAERENTEDA